MGIAELTVLAAIILLLFFARDIFRVDGSRQSRIERSRVRSIDILVLFGAILLSMLCYCIANAHY